MDIETTYTLGIQEDTIVTHYLPPGSSQANLSFYGSGQTHVTLQFNTRTLSQLQALIDQSQKLLTYLKRQRQMELNQQLSQLGEHQANGKALNAVPTDFPI